MDGRAAAGLLGMLSTFANDFAGLEYSFAVFGLLAGESFADLLDIDDVNEACRSSS